MVNTQTKASVQDAAGYEPIRFGLPDMIGESAPCRKSHGFAFLSARLCLTAYSYAW